MTEEWISEWLKDDWIVNSRIMYKWIMNDGMSKAWLNRE